jgi:NADPH:quinone reductase-like Zn-dependent oxidoreductase
MKAIVHHHYGPADLLSVEDIDKPTAGDNEVPIGVRAASVNPVDWHYMRGAPYAVRMGGGLRQPKDLRLGVDVAGRVEAVGRDVTQFKPGDAVFGSCRGAFAEYARTSESALVMKAENLTFEQAAERVIDYTREDFTTTGQRYDTILDCVGNHSLSDRRRALTDTGTLVLVGGPDEGRWLGPLAGVLAAVVLSRFVSQNLVMILASLSREGDLATLRDLMAAGTVTPVIDRRYGLTEVPEAIRYLEEGHARGKVVITIAP